MAKLYIGIIQRIEELEDDDRVINYWLKRVKNYTKRRELIKLQNLIRATIRELEKGL